MKQEIERKYAIKYIPQDIQIEKTTNIKQCFIYSDKITLIRLRKLTTINKKANEKVEYLYTVKTKGDIEYKKGSTIGNKYEIESYITQEQYENLLVRKISNTIDKTRIVVPIKNNLKAEIDIYYGDFEGFLTVEVEFGNSKEAEKFEKPDWFGDELGYKELSNRKLSEMTKEEFESKVTKEFLDNNKKLIKLLNLKNI